MVIDDGGPVHVRIVPVRWLGGPVDVLDAPHRNRAVERDKARRRPAKIHVDECYRKGRLRTSHPVFVVVVEPCTNS